MSPSLPLNGLSSCPDDSDQNGCRNGWQRRPNTELSEQERVDKRRLKHLLKRQMRQRKLEVRLEQARRRRDEAWIRQTERDLEEFWLEEQRESTANPGRQQQALATSTSRHDEQELEEIRSWIECVYHRLLEQLTVKEPQQPDNKKDAFSSSDGSEFSCKEYQTDQARQLLMCMTKATVCQSMFDNASALRGYTRQKFVERAFLVTKSLLLLSNEASIQPHHWLSSSNTSEESRRPEQGLICCQQLQERIKSIRSVCSIGAGPGGDAVGVLAWLRWIKENGTTQSASVERILLLDWAMEQWKQAILDPLCDLLAPDYAASRRVIQTAFCDVTRSLLSHETNATASGLLMTDNAASFSSSSCINDVVVDIKINSACESTNGYLRGPSRGSEDSLVSPTNASLLQVDLIVVSYLLSETRGRWHVFFQDLVDCIASGTVVLLTDPTAWQLHLFIEQVGSNVMDFVWLDSSMDRPELQQLEGRVGPAVLLGIKL